MSEIFQNAFTPQNLAFFGEAVQSTLIVTIVSTLLAYLIGVPLGILLYGTSKNGIFPNRYVNGAVGFVVNVIRSIPFIILLVITQPLAAAVVGTRIGDTAFIFHLVLAAAPFVARMIESSLREVDNGVIEAAQAMGSTNFQIMMKVVVPEAKPSLILGAAIAITTILGYTPMTYLIGGGGLGKIAIQFGCTAMSLTNVYIVFVVDHPCTDLTRSFELSCQGLRQAYPQQMTLYKITLIFTQRSKKIMKKVLTLIGTALLAAAVLASCGGKKDDKVIKVAASSSPHAEILEQCVEPLKAEGYTLEIKVMDDYVIPNNSTESGDVDANYFQHQPYLDSFNKDNGTHLVSIAKIHYEPFGIYAGKTDSLDALPEGAKIAVPNDVTNEARALLLLQDKGILTLKEGARPYRYQGRHC